jgi:hypothetical protein
MKNHGKHHGGRAHHDQHSDAASETTPAERPPAAASDDGAAAAAGNTAVDVAADQVDPPATADATTPPPGPNAIEDLIAKGNAADLIAFLKELHTRQSTLERWLQQYRSDQINHQNQLEEHQRVLASHADQIDAVGVYLSPAGAAEGEAAAEMSPPPPPPVVHARPADPATSGMGMGGVSGQRRQRGARTFNPSAPIPDVVKTAPPPRLPPTRPGASSAPLALPAATTPIVPPVLGVGDEFRIDPSKPGEHEVMTAAGPVLIRVKDRRAGAAGAMRRQGGGRTFAARPAGGDGK